MRPMTILAATAVVLGLHAATIGAALAQDGHEGHNHGPAEAPMLGIDDLAARAATVGSHFQLVAMPKDGQLVIFLDHTETNLPARGARIEILAGDALITAEESAPGLYLVAPWPADGLSPEEAESVELIATVVSGDTEEVLLARMSDTDAHDDHEGHDHGPVTGTTSGAKPGDRVALWDGVRPFALPVAAGLIALLGAVAGFRSTGRRRWIGLAVSGLSLVTLIATSSLV